MPRDLNRPVRVILEEAIADVEAFLATTPTPLPSPNFNGAVPTISPTTGTAGATMFTATDPTATGAVSYTRSWLLSGTAIGSGTTVTPATAGNLVRRVVATGATGLTTTVDSDPVTVSPAVVTPTLTLSGPQTYTENAPSGTTVANIGNVPSGVTPALTAPTNGRLAVAGNATDGWRLVTGLTTATPGSYSATVTATGANSVTATITVTAANAQVFPPISGTFSMPEKSAQGTIAGAVTGKTPGSTLALFSNAGGKLQMSGTNVQAGAVQSVFPADNPLSFVVRQTLEGYEVQDTPFNCAITDVLENPETTLSSNSFTAADGTLITAITPQTGPAFIVQPGTTVASGSELKVANNRVYSTAAGVAYQVPLDLDAEQWVQVDVVPLTQPTTGNSGHAGVILRASSTANTLYTVRQQIGGTDSGKFQVLRFNAGTATPLNTDNIVLSPTTAKTLRVNIRTEPSFVTLEIIVDGVSRGTVIDTSANRITTAGRIGIRDNAGAGYLSSATAGRHYDNFQGGTLAQLAAVTDTPLYAATRAYEEAVISPAPAAPRSTYPIQDLTRTRLSVPITWTTESVPYEPTRPLAKANGTLPSTFPVDFLIPYGTNHSSGNGGISFILGRYNTSATNGIEWLDFKEARAAGWLASWPKGITTADAIRFGDGSRQMETPKLYWDKRTNLWHMYVQVKRLSGDPTWQTQFTVRLDSDTPFQWPYPINYTTPAFSLPQTDTVGDGHTGYQEPGPNPFPDFPYPWISFGLAGGTDFSAVGRWGAPGPAGPWTYEGQSRGWRGRFLGPEFNQEFASSWRGVSVLSARRTSNGVVVLANVGKTAGGSGTGVTETYTCEVLLDNAGERPIANPIKVLSPASGSEAVGGLGIIDDVANNRRLYFYSDKLTGGALDIGLIADTQFRSPQNYSAAALTPALPATLTVDQTWNFVNAPVLPSGLTQALSGDAAHTYTANGLQVDFTSVSNTATRIEGVFGNTGYVPNNYQMLEFTIENYRNLLADNFSNIRLGFTADKALAALANTMLGVTFGLNNDDVYLNALQGGASQIPTGVLGAGPLISQKGLPYGTGVTPRMLGLTGIRIFPQQRLMIFRTIKDIEGHMVTIGAGFDLSVPLYPFFSMGGGNATQPVRNAIRSMTVKAG